MGQYHGTFRSPYAGPFSLQNYPERDVSLTTTLFLSLRLDEHSTLVFDPEIAGGRGFSGVAGTPILRTANCPALPRQRLSPTLRGST